MFERHGFLDARITDITAGAGAATGSFYSYFSSKEEIFTAVIDELNDHEGLHPPTMVHLTEEGADLELSIARAHRRYLESYEQNARIMAVMEQVTSICDDFRVHRTRSAQAYVRANTQAVERLQAAGRADPGLDPKQTARSLSTMVSRSAFVSFVLEEETAEQIDVLVCTLTRLWINALGLRAAVDTAAWAIRSSSSP